LFEQAHLDPAKPPTHWDEVIDQAQRLTRRDSHGSLRVAGLAIPTDGSEDQIGFFLTTMHQFGGPALLSGDRTKATFNNEFGVKALQLMVDLQHKYGIAPPPPATQASNESGFDAGRIAMIIDGKWGVQSAHQYAPGIPLGIAQWPYPRGGRPGNYVTVGAYMIYKHCQHPDQAYTFIKWMTGTQAENARMRNYNVSPRRDALSDPQIRALESKILTIGTERFVPQGVTLPYTTKMAQILTTLGPELQAAVLKTKTVARALKDAESKVNAILASQL
jgi:ABC-type glycerol-3-phosphate transport system substrate-binding protein